MPQQPIASIQNAFTKGLVTEFTGLNFPENAATDTDNSKYSLIGSVTRREGIDIEVNGESFQLDRSSVALHTYKWNNAGGDGVTQLMVTQIGPELYFWDITASTEAQPLSHQRLSSVIELNPYRSAGTPFVDNSFECEFISGNGYLFVFHPQCDPIYCTYSAGVVTASLITVKVRDFTGVPEIGDVNNRPTTLSTEHLYNLTNQGWLSGSPWSANSTTSQGVSVGPHNFTVQAGITGVTPGQTVRIIYTGTLPPIPVPGGFTGNTSMMSGTVTSYSGTTMVIAVSILDIRNAGLVGASWTISPINTGYLNTWNSAIGNYPSNADIWWYFKDETDVFNPASTIGNVSLASGRAPGGHYVLDAFNQQRDLVSGQAITDIITLARPTNGTWFQGRIWYTGINAQQPATGDVGYYSWTENIYFSQTVITPDQFGNCYQVNDPTSETLFGILPTDGGVITLQNSGPIYKLFPVQNGLLVFAANGIKFITGSQGIGFQANDYTITDISGIQSISTSSFVNVLGYPYFWNQEGIYTVQPVQGGGLGVTPITVGTIESFYDEIPLSSKKYARGDYHPIDYIIQWIYRDTEADSVDTRYNFNKILNYNTYNKAFFPYTIPNSTRAPTLNSINYVAGPGGSNVPAPGFKYFMSYFTQVTPYFSFADEHDTNYVDWASVFNTNFDSYFVTGYQIRGQAQKMFFPGYLYMFSNSGPDFDTAYKIQSIWDYASSGDTGRWSHERVTEIPPVNYGMYYRRHKLRGHGLVMQFKISSVDGKPFDIIGWSSSDNVNTGI